MGDFSPFVHIAMTDIFRFDKNDMCHFLGVCVDTSDYWKVYVFVLVVFFIYYILLYNIPI